MKIGIGGFLLDFTTVYDSMTEESDFMFRGDKGEFYYKGFIFLPIGAVLSFFHFDFNRFYPLAFYTVFVGNIKIAVRKQSGVFV